jgi:hypothetical protein
MQSIILAVLGVMFTVMASYQLSPSIIKYIQAKKAENLVEKEKAIFDAVKRYITIKGTMPTTQNLVDEGYIDANTVSDNGWGVPITLAIDPNTGVVTLNTDIPDSYGKSAYLQSWRNWIKPTNPSGDTVASNFVIPTDVLGGNAGGILSGATVSTTPPDPSTSKFWYDTSSGKSVLKMSDGTTWTTATLPNSGMPPVTSENTVTNTGSLPTSGNVEGDVRYVYNATTNTIDTYTYYGTSWSLLGSGGTTTSAVASCKTNWVFIPGSENIEGSSKGWCVMKYEATPYTPAGYTMDYNAYNWQDDYDAKINIKVASLPQNPYNYVSSNNARSMCSSSHLVDDAGLAMAGGFPMKYNVFHILATNLANNPANWSGGVVGSGYIYSGHNDNAPANTITPSSSDADGYVNTGQTTGNQRRTLFTSEGKAIWDLAGNVWEEMYEQQSVGNSGWNEYTSVTTNAFAPQLIMSQSWNSTQGVGQSYGTGVASNILSSGSYWLLRGGDWNDGSSAGLFASHWNAGSLSDRSGGVGVRCIVPAQ